MSQPEPIYRIYLFDAASMNLSIELVEASNHEEAIELAEAMGRGSKCEIWNGRDLIATLGAEGDRRAATGAGSAVPSACAVTFSKPASPNARDGESFRRP